MAKETKAQKAIKSAVAKGMAVKNFPKVTMSAEAYGVTGTRKNAPISVKETVRRGKTTVTSGSTNLGGMYQNKNRTSVANKAIAAFNKAKPSAIYGSVTGRASKTKVLTTPYKAAARKVSPKDLRSAFGAK